MTEKQLQTKKIIEGRRRARIAELSVLFSLFALTVLLLSFFGKYLWAFLPLIAVFVLLIIRIGKLLSDKSVMLRGKEVSGVIVKKAVRSRIKDSRIMASYGSNTEPSPWQSYAVRIQCGTVYVRTDDGDVVSLGKFDEDVINFLEEGDRVIRFRGSRYPIILNESESRQKWLCPACGEVNPDGRDCIRCGFDFNLIGNTNEQV